MTDPDTFDSDTFDSDTDTEQLAADQDGTPLMTDQEDQIEGA